MKKLLFALLFFINFSSYSLGEIVTIQHLNEVTSSKPALILFDIDDTLIDSSTMAGSKAWRSYIRKATENDNTLNWHDLFSLWIANHHPYSTVESCTVDKVHELQNAGHLVLGLTSREKTRWYDLNDVPTEELTHEQLQVVGIQFSDAIFADLFPGLTTLSQYSRGVFFADIEPKGNFLLYALNGLKSFPEKILFIDDKLSQVESVDEALSELGIDHVAYYYQAIEEKSAQFDPLIANIELYYSLLLGGVHLTDSEAKAIAETYPEQDEKFYLEASKKLLVESSKDQGNQ